MTSDLSKKLDSFLEEQRAQYKSDLEPFDVYAAKVRQKFESFYTTFSRGRSLVKAEEHPIPDFETLFTTYLEKGTLYQLLGYSVADLEQFYKTAYEYLEQRRFQDGYDAYFFLLAIAPHVPECWLNFGYSCCQLGEPILGIEGFGNAIERDPANPAGYLAACGTYLKLKDKESAALVCDAGLEYAKTNHNEELKATLQEARRQVLNER